MPDDAVADLGMTWSQAGLTVVTAIGVYAAIITLSRVFGQRQFTTSSAYDLAFTFALGSIVGRVILVRTSLLTAVLGLATMFLLHAGTGWLHHRVDVVHRLIQNQPILLVIDGEIIEDNLRRAATSHTEVRQQVRLAGLGRMADVGAMVLERNGQMSVIAAGSAREAAMFQEVRDQGRLRPDR